MTLRHFLRLSDATRVELEQIIVSAINARQRPGGHVSASACGKTLAMIFDKSSTRTRVSFAVGFSQLGGSSMFLSGKDLQLGRGEPIEDTARVISSMVDMVVLRTGAHNRVERFAEYSSVPVINGLTSDHHPCQLLADIMTYMELRGSISGKRVAFIGDGAGNLCSTYHEAARIFDFSLVVAAPQPYAPRESDWLEHTTDPLKAARGADLLVTDVWISMGDETGREERLTAFAPYQVTRSLLDQGDNPLFLHCLPAHRGEEVDEEVLDDPRSGVWRASENRLHAQKMLMEFLLANQQDV